MVLDQLVRRLGATPFTAWTRTTCASCAAAGARRRRPWCASSSSRVLTSARSGTLRKRARALGRAVRRPGGGGRRSLRPRRAPRPRAAARLQRGSGPWAPSRLSAWPSGRGPCPEGQAVVPREVRLDAHGRIPGRLEQVSDRGSLLLADLQCKEPAGKQSRRGPRPRCGGRRRARPGRRRARAAARGAPRPGSPAKSPGCGRRAGCSPPRRSRPPSLTGAKRSPWRTSTRSATPSASALAARHLAAAPRRRRWPPPRPAGARRRGVTAMQPAAGARGRAPGPRVLGEGASTASTRSSVSGRGMSTRGSTWKVRP